MLRPASDNCCCWKIGDFFSKYHANRLKLNVCRFIEPIISCSRKASNCQSFSRIDISASNFACSGTSTNTSASGSSVIIPEIRSYIACFLSADSLPKINCNPIGSPPVRVSQYGYFTIRGWGNIRFKGK